jgi:hypothetical protein
MECAFGASDPGAIGTSAETAEGPVPTRKAKGPAPYQHVIRRVHVGAELIGGKPELGLEAEVGAGLLGGVVRAMG